MDEKQIVLVKQYLLFSINATFNHCKMLEKLLISRTHIIKGADFSLQILNFNLEYTNKINNFRHYRPFLHADQPLLIELLASISANVIYYLATSIATVSDALQVVARSLQMLSPCCNVINLTTVGKLVKR